MSFAGQIESQTFLILFLFLSLKISSFLTFWLFLSVKYMFPPLKCFNSSKTVLFSPTKFLIGTSSPRSSRSPFRRLTDTMTVNCYFPYYFLFFLFFHFSPPQPFLIEGAPINLGVHPFPDPVGILGHPGCHFGFLRFL